MSPAEGSRLETVAPGVRRLALRTPTLPPATHTNCWVLGWDDLIVVEPASPWDDEQARLDQALAAVLADGARIRAIFLTHHHGDHIGGVTHLATRLGVPVWAHALTRDRVRPGVQVDQEIPADHLEHLPGPGGGMRLSAMHTPGHAPGHLVLSDEVTGTMIAGDMVAGEGFIVIDPDDDGDMSAYLESLRRMRARAPRLLCPAHGAAMADAAAVGKLDEYVTHRLAREAKVAAGLVQADRPVTRQELLPIVYADVHPSMHFVADRSLAAHLAKLVADGRATLDGEHYALR